jgi:hypothetical protein
VIACLAACLLGSPGLLDEASVTLHGDMPKYLMNGVYMLDLLRDRPFGSLDTFLEYTQLYYARYPALTLGHHPPLLSAVEVPVFAALGVSVVSARLVVFVSYVASVALLFVLVNRLYGWIAGLVAALFLATSPQTVLLGRSVLSEMPTVALILAAAYALHRFCATERRLPLAAFVTAATLSLYAKQLAVLVFPAYFVAALLALGPRRLLGRDVLWAAGVIVVAALPLVPMTFILSKANVTWTVAAMQHANRQPASQLMWIATKAQLAVPVLLLAIVGLARLALQRDLRAAVFATWALGVIVGVSFIGRSEPGRYAVLAVPALCALAAATVVDVKGRTLRATAIALCVLAGGYQATIAARVSVEGAGGYEEAARFVLESDPGTTVIFSGDIDTGFFTFFIRKHDADRRLVVLRADKIFTTSRMANVSFRDRIESPEEIYVALRRLGTRYVVIEDRPTRSAVLTWLQEELRTSNFVERWRRPIETRDPRLRGRSLVIYEFLGAGPPDPDAELSMDLPLVGRSLAVRLSDLIQRKYLR